MDLNKIKKYTFELADSNMYVVVENNCALIIDPNVSEEALCYLKNEKVEKVIILLTHEHYDHVSGVTWLQSQFPCEIICHKETDISLRKGKNNRPAVIGAMMIIEHSREDIKSKLKELPTGFYCSADVTFDTDFFFVWENHEIKLFSTPGHSKGSCCIELDDSVVFTGDSLIPGFPTITGFPGGDVMEYREKTIPYLESLSDTVWILSGHGEKFRKSEIKIIKN